MKTILLWDWSTRLFHWLLVLCVFVAIATGLFGGVDLMVWHARAGIAVVGLIAFRLVWGFCGSTYARFGHFFPTPQRIQNYLNGQWNGVGHNPLGAFSVFALLFLCAFQALTGLFSTDEILLKGPLFALVDLQTSLDITSVHKIAAWVLMALIGLHVLAIVFYKLVKKDNLVLPMITGKKDVRDAENYQPAALWAWVLAILLFLLALYGASGIWIAEPETAAIAPVSAPEW